MFNLPSVFNTGGHPEAAALGDVTGEGHADLIVMHRNECVLGLSGDGSGGFGSASALGVGMDIPVRSSCGRQRRHGAGHHHRHLCSNSVPVFLNEGSGSFYSHRFFRRRCPQSVLVADVDGDVFLDSGHWQ